MIRPVRTRFAPAHKGAAAFCLQSLGNLVVLTVLFVLLSLVAGARLQRWFSTDPRRIEMWWTRWPTANVGLRTGIEKRSSS